MTNPYDSFDVDWNYIPNAANPSQTTDYEQEADDFCGWNDEPNMEPGELDPIHAPAVYKDAMEVPSRLILTNFVPSRGPYYSRNPSPDRKGDVETLAGETVGSLHSIAAPLRFRQYVKSIARLDNDVRLRCVQWMTDMRGIVMDAVVASFGHSLGFHGEPTVIPGYRGEASFVWSTKAGGVVVCISNTGGACGVCLGCVSVDESKRSVPEKCVYFIRGDDGGPVKIGTSINPEERLDALQTAHPTKLRIIGLMKGGKTVERALHSMFALDRLRPNGEWFHPSVALIDFIHEIGGGFDA